MPFLNLLVLTFIQGMTEFLPISSSGHLILLPTLFGWSEQGLEIDVALHVGTLLAVFIYFWSDLQAMIVGCFKYLTSGFKRELYDKHVQLAFYLVIATIPAVIFGFFLKKNGVDHVRQVVVIGVTSIVFGLALFLADQFGRRAYTMKDMNVRKSLLIGLAQAIALIPGTSRSGICITAGLFLGFDRVTSARFAFLLSIPAILGAALLTGYDAYKVGKSVLVGEVITGIFFSMVFGLMAIHFMITYLTRHSLTPFVIYRLILGAGVFFLA